jgi:predicted  nucleic acid-binding Zn-ribbon protein
MNPDLERLIRLQRAESDLRRAEAELAEAPRHRSELDAALAAQRARLDTARHELAGGQKARRQHEGDLQDLEAKRSRLKGQLMDVKTNKEYTAMLHEIEAVERDIRAREDQILAEMERAENLTLEVKHEEETHKQAEERHRADLRAVDERARGLDEQVRRLTAERDAIASTVPAGILDLFHRVARSRGGVAVAQAQEGMCQVCHVKLRLQFYADLKRNEEIVQCPACNRILYYEAPPPTVSAEP